VESEFVLEQDLVLDWRLAFKTPTGMIFSLFVRVGDSECRVCRYLIWMGSDTEKTFGPEVNDMIRKHLLPDRATIWDTKKRGTLSLPPFLSVVIIVLIGIGRGKTGCDEVDIGSV